jgi:hypothetical protein
VAAGFPLTSPPRKRLARPSSLPIFWTSGPFYMRVQKFKKLAGADGPYFWLREPDVRARQEGVQAARRKAARSTGDLFPIEAEAALAYWECWTFDLRFVPRNWPAQWERFEHRASAISGGGRHATQRDRRDASTDTCRTTWGR